MDLSARFKIHRGASSLPQRSVRETLYARYAMNNGMVKTVAPQPVFCMDLSARFKIHRGASPLPQRSVRETLYARYAADRSLVPRQRLHRP